MPNEQLRIPGPTPLPDRVLRAAGRQMINHRSAEFADMLSEVTCGIQTALRTESEILLFPASGTGGMEGVIANMLSPGEPVLVCSCGTFGERWIKIATAFGVDVVASRFPVGQPVIPEVVERALTERPEIGVVFLTHNETSTGVSNDVAALARVAHRRGALVCLDSISGAPCLPLDVDGLGIDVVVGASQKGWLAPPGVAIIAISERALERSRSARLPRSYFDFQIQMEAQKRGQTPTTPALSVLFALQEGLRMVHEEGIEAVWARHSRVATNIRAGIASLDLELLAAEGARSDTVTAIMNPTESPQDLVEFMSVLRAKYGLSVAGGVGELTGRIFRIGHLGAIQVDDAAAILDSLARGLKDVCAPPSKAKVRAEAPEGDLAAARG